MWGKDESAAVYGSCLYSYVIRHIQDYKLPVPTDRGMHANPEFVLELWLFFWWPSFIVQTFSSTWWCNTYIFILFLPFLSDGIKIATFLHIKGICMFYFSNNHQLCNERVVNCDKILAFHCVFTSPVSRFSFVSVCPFCCWGSICI